MTRREALTNAQWTIIFQPTHHRFSMNYEEASSPSVTPESTCRASWIAIDRRFTRSMPGCSRLDGWGVPSIGLTSSKGDGMGRLVIDLSEFTVVKQHDIDHDNPTPWVFGVADCVWPIASTALTRNLDFIFGKKSTDPGLSPTHRRSLQAAESKVNDCGAEAYPSLLETRVGNAPVTLRL